MKSIIQFFYVYLLIYIVPCEAQVNNLQKEINLLIQNSDIVWVSEFSTQLNLDYGSKEILSSKAKNSSRVLKLLYNTSITSIAPDSSLLLKYKWLVQDFFLKQSIYRDKELMIKMDTTEVYNLLMENVTTFDSETFDEKTTITNKNFSDVMLFEYRYLVYYTTKDNTFKVKPLAIAPLKVTIGTKSLPEPLFWLPLANVEKLNLNKSSITWAKQIQFDCLFDDNSTSLKVLKGDQSLTQIWSSFLNAIEVKKCYIPSNSDWHYNQSLAYLPHSLLSKSEKEEFIKPAFDTNFIKGISLIQNWYWDKKEQKLKIVTELWGPLHLDVNLNCKCYPILFYVN